MKRPLPWALFAASIALLATGAALSFTSGLPNQEEDSAFFPIVISMAVVAFGLIGALVASRQPENAISWIFLSFGLVAGLIFCLEAVHEQLRAAGHADSLFARVIDWSGSWTWVPLVFLPTTFPFLLFPDGHPPSPRWRMLVWAAGIGIAAMSFNNGFDPANFDGGRNPLGLEPPHSIVEAVGFGSFLLLASLVGAVAAVVVRFRRATGDQRQQMKWLAFGGILSAVIIVGLFLAGGILDSAGVNVEEGGTVATVMDAAILLAVLSIPIAAGIAILKHRLYDIDIVINKTLVYGSLAAFITGVYVGVVVGIGSIVGRGDEPNLGLSILATAVVAVAFQPVRARLQRLANRLVYGKRATPYEVLSEFGHRMAGTYAADDVLPRMARILGEGTGAREAKVWLRVGTELAPAAAWPNANGDVHVAQSDADLVVPVLHQGEELGALSIVMSAGDRITPAEEKLTRDLASQAGLVLRNVKLIEDLKASRVRLVQAQDEERRRIERNIHDGAQQQLVALQVKLGLTKAIAPKDPRAAERLLAELQAETDQALQDLRDLARGIYPPLLADQGLNAALTAQARKSPIPVTVQADSIGRYSQEAEAAVYFCVLEALQNVAKYANAERVTVRLAADDGRLTFEVVDDGDGFDPTTTSRGSGLTNMADRLAALGGEIVLTSRPGLGTTVLGLIPVPDSEVS